jgi:hypothetical protein
VSGEGVDTAHTDAVQTTGNLVGAFIELTTGVEHGHDDLEGALVQLLVLVDGDTASIVLTVQEPSSLMVTSMLGAEACHSLVDRVVHGLVDEVVESLSR